MEISGTVYGTCTCPMLIMTERETGSVRASNDAVSDVLRFGCVSVERACVRALAVAAVVSVFQTCSWMPHATLQNTGISHCTLSGVGSGTRERNIAHSDTHTVHIQLYDTVTTASVQSTEYLFTVHTRSSRTEYSKYTV